ncbi:MAG: YbjN domain-containing protein [Gemmatimonadetes bacterium]|nr:YbjN domain-containing protein [Gemmatimonadota bacterium]
MSLRSEVLQTLNAICEGAGVTARYDCDIEIAMGEATLFVRIFEEKNTLCIYQYIANNVTRTFEVDEFLHDVCRDYILYRAFWEADQIILRVDLLAKPFVPAHFQHALDTFAEYSAAVAPEAQGWSKW